MSKSIDERTVYSVWIRKGPDKVHYDLIFEDDRIKLVYLGEYWDKTKPYPALQRRSDMLLYSLRKHRRRQQSGSTDKFDIEVKYCDIRSFKLVKPQDAARVRPIRRDATDTSLPKGILELVLTDGRRLSIEFSAKVYELVKKLVKKYLARMVEECQEKAVKKAR